jgi:exopolyphosphatase
LSVLGGHVGTYIPLLQIPRKDLALRPELLCMFAQTGIDPNDVCTLENLDWIDQSKTSLFLVDHNVPRGPLSKSYRFNSPQSKMLIEGIIDHHEDEKFCQDRPEPMKYHIIKQSGSCSSLVANWMMQTHKLNPEGSLLDDNYQETHGIAKLLLSAILLDTANLNYKMTVHDEQAVPFLLQYLPDFDSNEWYTKLQTAKSSIEGMSLTDIFRRDYKEFKSDLGKLGFSTINRSVSDLLDRFSDFKDEMRQYIKKQELQVYIIMTVYSEGDTFKRGGVIWTNHKDFDSMFRSEGQAKYGIQEVSDAISESSLGLGDGMACWVFEQEDVSASRKQIVPLVQDVIKKLEEKNQS